MIPDRQIRLRVRKGAGLLDESRPGWELEVRPGDIDVWDPASCVLGQLTGDYWTGLRSLGVEVARFDEDVNPAVCRWAAQHGYALDPEDVHEAGDRAERDLLNQAWRAEVTRRVGLRRQAKVARELRGARVTTGEYVSRKAFV